jgi:hypothetical protein
MSVLEPPTFPDSTLLPPLLPLRVGHDWTDQDGPGPRTLPEQGERDSAGRRGTLQDALRGTVKAEIAGSRPVGRGRPAASESSFPESGSAR